VPCLGINWHGARRAGGGRAPVGRPHVYSLSTIIRRGPPGQDPESPSQHGRGGVVSSFVNQSALPPRWSPMVVVKAEWKDQAVDASQSTWVPPFHSIDRGARPSGIRARRMARLILKRVKHRRRTLHSLMVHERDRRGRRVPNAERSVTCGNIQQRRSASAPAPAPAALAMQRAQARVEKLGVSGRASLRGRNTQYRIPGTLMNSGVRPVARDRTTCPVPPLLPRTDGRPVVVVAPERAGLSQVTTKTFDQKSRGKTKAQTSKRAAEEREGEQTLGPPKSHVGHLCPGVRRRGGGRLSFLTRRLQRSIIAGAALAALAWRLRRRRVGAKWAVGPSRRSVARPRRRGRGQGVRRRRGPVARMKVGSFMRVQRSFCIQLLERAMPAESDCMVPPWSKTSGLVGGRQRGRSPPHVIGSLIQPI
jgi:hypothetical protein